MAKVHRAYRHSWWRRSKEITERDYQAMCNFADEGISFETLAQHFCCSVAHVQEEIILTEHYGYRRRPKLVQASDWDTGSDALKSFLHVIQAPRHEMTWQEYLDTVDWDVAYDRYGDRAAAAVMERAQEIASKSNLELTFID